MIRLPTSPGTHIISVIFVEVGAAVATAHLIVCGFSGCCSVGGVCAWDAWLPATARLAVGVFAVTTNLPFWVVPRRMFRHDHCQGDGEAGAGNLRLHYIRLFPDPRFLL